MKGAAPTEPRCRAGSRPHNGQFWPVCNPIAFRLTPGGVRGRVPRATVRKVAKVERRGATSPPRPLWQLVLAACLFVASFTDVFRLAHLLAVRHVTCPYDGVLVHEDDLEVHARADDETPASPKLRRVSLGARHDHGACAGTSAADRPFAVLVLAAAPATDESALVTPPALASSEAHARPVLSFAPKLPPPA
jgi:hypothetical protein